MGGGWNTCAQAFGHFGQRIDAAVGRRHQRRFAACSKLCTKVRRLAARRRSFRSLCENGTLPLSLRSDARALRASDARRRPQLR